MVAARNLPAALRENGLFCCWRYEERDGKQTKVPYNPRTSKGAQSTNPDTFAPLDVALAAMERGGYSGIGVGIFGNLGAIDIDHCISDAGELSAMAADIVDAMDAYTETSPSGHGIRILFTVPDGFQYDKARYYINKREVGLEVYIAGATNKYVTVTGNAVTPGKGLEECGERLAAVLERYMQRPAKKTLPAQPAQSANVPAADFDDYALIETAKRNPAFKRLWNGDISGYKSHSEADLALCNMLAWRTNGDAARVDRLFRQSGLMRPKWNRSTAGSTYGAITVQSAVASCQAGHAQRRTDVPPPSTVKPPDYSDAGNAETLTRIYRNDLLFVDALGWLLWNGQRWERSDHKALAAGIDLSAWMLQEAMTAYKAAIVKHTKAQLRFSESEDDADRQAVKDALEEQKNAKEYLKHAKKLREARQLKNMLDLSIPSFVIKADRLDANPFDLNTPAGIVNLTDGRIRPHERTAYCSQITAAGAGEAGRAMWADFLNTVTCGDVSLQRFLQEVSGMALIGTVYHEGIVIAYGGGRNGKSTFFNALALVLGDYAGSIDIKTLTTDKGNKGASLATLRGKRLVIAGELEEHQRLSVATLKQVASTDSLTIEEKYKKPETIRQTHTLILFTNHLPRVGSTDSGTWRRLLVVPFKATIPEGGGVQNYGELLAAQAGPAILAWAIEGAIGFIRNGFRLGIPVAVSEATEEYRQREDWLNNFIDERCVREGNARTGARELYTEYKSWAQDNGEYVRRENDFAAAMTAAGFLKIKPKGRYWYVGLRIDYASQISTPYPTTG